MGTTHLGTLAVDELSVGGTPVQAVDLSGVTASSAELNLNDGAIAGTSVANKTLALGDDKNTDVIALPVSGLKIGEGAGTAVTGTAEQLNALTDSALVTAVASPAVYSEVPADIAAALVAAGLMAAE